MGRRKKPEELVGSFMPDYTAPGVYVEGIGPNSHPITGVSTSTAAFIGITASGPFTPTLITGWTEYELAFGSPMGAAFLGHAVRGFFQNGGTQCYILRIEATADPAESLKALEGLDDISIVCSPDEKAVAGMAAALIEHCERMRYRIAVLDAPQTPAPTDGPPDVLRSSYAAYYYPWVLVSECADHARMAVPPGGHVAGIYARTDLEQGVWHAPAGKVLLGIAGLDQSITDEQGEVLNTLGVDTLRYFQGRGNLLWGARTTSQDPEWKYVNIRRYLNYLEHSVDSGTQWVVFENNGEALWDTVRRSASDFLFNEWRNGALQGSRPEEAFFVRCDRSTMTQDDIDNGRLIVLVGVAPVRPAEFVIFRIGQWTGNVNPDDCYVPKAR
jgi:phage tail sheath protein FI